MTCGPLTSAEMAELMAEEDAAESRIALLEQRQWANNNRAWIDAEWDALPDVPRTIAGHLADMSPEQYDRLNAEWNA